MRRQLIVHLFSLLCAAWLSLRGASLQAAHSLCPGTELLCCCRPLQEVELGLGVVSAAPTAVELHEKQPHVQEQQLHVVAATPEGQAALEAALHGSFADGLP
jgi:hypothetical protein